MSAELTDEGKYTDPVDYTTDSSVEGGWVKVVKTFTPQVTGTASAYIIGEGAEGIFYVDDIQLEKGEAPSNFNLLDNGDHVGEFSMYTASAFLNALERESIV